MILSILLCIILVTTVTCQYEDEYEDYYGGLEHCKLNATVVKESRSAFLHFQPIGEGCDNMGFEYIMSPCDNKSQLVDEIYDKHQKRFRLCPKWKGCTTIAIKNQNFSAKFESEDDNRKLMPEPKDVEAYFKEDIQRLHFTIHVSDHRVTSAKIRRCKVLSKQNNKCSCPDVFPVFGKKLNMAWIFDLNGKGFENNCTYAFKMSLSDECYGTVMVPPKIVSVSYSSDLKNTALSAERMTVVKVLVILVTTFVIILIAFSRCWNYPKSYTIPVTSVDSIDKSQDSQAIFLLYEFDVCNQAQQLKWDLEKALKVPSKGSCQINKDKRDGFPADAGITSRWQVHDLHNITDGTKLGDPLLWVYKRLASESTSCKVIILSSAQAKATELCITRLEKQEITHSCDNLLGQLRGQEQDLFSTVDTGGSKGLVSKNVDRFSCKSTFEPVTKSVNGHCNKSTEPTAIVDETKKELLDNHTVDITEEFTDKGMSLVKPTRFLFKEALRFIIRHNIGFNSSKFFQISLAGGDPHVLQYVTPSRVFTWPDHKSELLQRIQN